MRILFIQHLASLDRPSGFMLTAYLEPLGLEYLASSVEARGHETVVAVGCVDCKRFREQLKEFRPDVVGFSVYSFAYRDTLKLARIVKEEYPIDGGPAVTVFGGYHPTACPEETAAEPWVDFTIVGEGEETFCDLLEVIEDDRNPSHVKGLLFRDSDGVIIRTQPRERIKLLDALPLPKRDAESLTESRQYQITFPPPSQQKAVAQVMYSRGCPFSCYFCAAEVSWGGEVVWRDPAAVCDEMEKLVREYGTNIVYFPDLTFNANKSRVLEFCREFQKRDIPLHWWGLFRLDLLDDEMLEALVQAKCVKLSIGIESPSEEGGGKIKSHYNLKPGFREHILGRANELGLILKAFIIIGFPEDTEEKIQSYTRHLHDLEFDDIRVSFATPFPGTRFYDEAKERGYLPDKIDWSNMTTETPILLHPTISKQRLIDLQKQLVSGFYLSKEYADHAVNKISRFPHLQQSWLEYFEFLNRKEVFRHNKTEFTLLMERLNELQRN